MFPDLGKYASDVLTAYGITFALLALLIWRSLARSAAVRRRLADAEARRAASQNMSQTSTPEGAQNG